MTALLGFIAYTAIALTLGVLIGKAIARADEKDRMARQATRPRHPSAPQAPVYVPAEWL